MHHASGPPQSRGCGVCRGCQTREDCGRCRVCLRPPRPGLRRQWRCIQRRCLRVSQAAGAGTGGARAGAELILLLNLLLLPPNLALPTSCLLFSFSLFSPSWPCLPAPVCQHLAHRLRRHHQRCQRRPPLAVAPPAVSAPSHTACLSHACFLRSLGRRVLCLPGATIPKLIYFFGFLLG